MVFCQLDQVNAFLRDSVIGFKSTYFGEKCSGRYRQEDYINPHFGRFSPCLFGGAINIDCVDRSFSTVSKGFWVF